VRSRRTHTPADSYHPSRLFQRRTDLPHFDVIDARRAENWLITLDFVKDGRALHRQQVPTRPQQRQAPSHQAIQWSDSPGGDPICVAHAGNRCGVLSATPDHLHLIRDAQQFSGLGEKERSTLERLNQIDLHIRSGQCERNAWQAGTAADIDNACAIRNQFGQRRGIQDVPMPEPLDLAGAKEATFNANRRQQLAIPLRNRQPSTEYRGRASRS